ncbi:GAF domain-containing sensor histidine kinase [Synechocystis sp. PCC 7509]|uniref:sensor histidine kinase n=1 Tax=Synechocystis sp. PCC 7509 TaxID=927677 RepID=UPI0002ACC1AC|nr:GAF domain-containing sensor histidine kinase [Synechocystis sp. PCC 7509]
MKAPLPDNEAQRLKALYGCKILDTASEQAFDDITRLAAQICGTPISLVSLVEAERQWFKSKVGLEAIETSRDVSFCAHAILQPDILIVSDTLVDKRFATNPLVTSDPQIRFYAGVPLFSPQGYALGTLCVIDFVSRKLSQEQVEALRILGRQASSQIELRCNLVNLVSANEALQKNEDRLRLLESVAVNANDAILITDAEPIEHPGPQIVYVNQAFTKMTGYSLEDVLGKTPRLLQGSKTDQDALDKIRVALKAWQPVRVELINYCKDGSEFWVELSITPVTDQKGWYTHWVSVQRDITERKQIEEKILKALEKEKELGELKSRFVSMVSHEFRTPLTTILSSAELLEHYSHKSSEKEKLSFFYQIRTAIQRMTQLLNDVLAINKAEAGKLEFKPNYLNLEEFCRALVKEMQINSRNKHVIFFSSQGQCPDACMDEKLLLHIFTNLLSNAIKYSPQGGTIYFKVNCRNEDVIFQVKDKGIGISTENQQRLFEPFHRGENVGNIPGTGLGLSIVKRLVELHEGHITVTSQIGIGTTFTVKLPSKQQS